MRGCLGVACLGWGIGLSAVAAEGSVGPTLRSGSGQFVVAAPGPGARFAGELAATNTPGWIELEGPSLVLTCERVKHALLWELGALDRWQGTIYVVVNPAMTNNQAPLIGAQVFRQGWQYRLELPARMEVLALVRGVVHAVLLEMANRQAGTRSAEIPLWLAEGLTLHLVRSSLVDLAVAPPNETVARVGVNSKLWEVRRPDPLAEARERLRGHAAMSVARLGEVTPDALAPETWRTFQASAHVFVYNLLQLPGGRSRLLATIRGLPAVLNWQQAFLQAFQPGFARMLEVEKWWSVVLVRFTGQDPMNAWSRSEALARLASVLEPAVLTPATAGGASVRARLRLQELIRDWAYARQVPVLQQVQNQLAAIRVKLPPEAAVLADAYRQVLADYVEGRKRLSLMPVLAVIPSTSASGLVTGTNVRLDELDARRAQEAELPAERTGPARSVAP